MSACPKCKGTSGVEFKMWVEHTMFMQWDGPEECVDSGETRVGLCTCIDCGARFRMSSIAAAAKPSGEE